MTTLSPLDRPAARIARTLIRRFGRPCTLVDRGETDFNPSTGETTHQAPVEVETRWVPAEQEAGRQGMDVARMTELGQRVVMVPDPGVEVDTRFRVETDGAEWSVVTVRPVFSGTRDAAFILVLEEG